MKVKHGGNILKTETFVLGKNNLDIQIQLSDSHSKYFGPIDELSVINNPQINTWHPVKNTQNTDSHKRVGSVVGYLTLDRRVVGLSLI